MRESGTVITEEHFDVIQDTTVEYTVIESDRKLLQSECRKGRILECKCVCFFFLKKGKK